MWQFTFGGKKNAVSFSRFECVRSFPYSCITHHLKNVQLVFWIELAILYRAQISIFLIVSFFSVLKKTHCSSTIGMFFFNLIFENQVRPEISEYGIACNRWFEPMFFRSTMHICHLNSCIIIWFPFTDSIMNKLRQINDKTTNKKVNKTTKKWRRKKKCAQHFTEKSRRKSINVNFCNPVDP